MPTPKQLLLEHTYGGDLAGDIAALVADGKGWREIAQHVTTETGVKVSHESLRQWYGQSAEAPAGAA